LSIRKKRAWQEKLKGIKDASAIDVKEIVAEERRDWRLKGKQVQINEIMLPHLINYWIKIAQEKGVNDPLEFAFMDQIDFTSTFEENKNRLKNYLIYGDTVENIEKQELPEQVESMSVPQNGNGEDNIEALLAYLSQAGEQATADQFEKHIKKLTEERDKAQREGNKELAKAAENRFKQKMQAAQEEIQKEKNRVEKIQKEYEEKLQKVQEELDKYRPKLQRFTVTKPFTEGFPYKVGQTGETRDEEWLKKWSSHLQVGDQKPLIKTGLPLYQAGDTVTLKANPTRHYKILNRIETPNKDRIINDNPYYYMLQIDQQSATVHESMLTEYTPTSTPTYAPPPTKYEPKISTSKQLTGPPVKAALPSPLTPPPTPPPQIPMPKQEGSSDELWNRAQQTIIKQLRRVPDGTYREFLEELSAFEGRPYTEKQRAADEFSRLVIEQHTSIATPLRIDERKQRRGYMDLPIYHEEELPYTEDVNVYLPRYAEKPFPPDYTGRGLTSQEKMWVEEWWLAQMSLNHKIPEFNKKALHHILDQPYESWQKLLETCDSVLNAIVKGEHVAEIQRRPMPYVEIEAAIIHFTSIHNYETMAKLVEALKYHYFRVVGIDKVTPEQIREVARKAWKAQNPAYVVPRNPDITQTVKDYLVGTLGVDLS